MAMGDPLKQFAIKEMGNVSFFGYDVAFTNQSLWLFISTAIITALLVLSSRKRAVVPGRWQAFAEVTYEFMAGMLESTTGRAGLKYVPLIMTLMLFIAAINLMGMVPGSYTSTSQITITFALALMVFVLVWIVGLARHGLHFFSLFLPAGTPWPLVPIMIPLELISFFARPATLAIRLMANMLAGHILLKIFAGFAIMLASMGIGGILGSIAPAVMLVALTGLEIFVALLQAYIFTVLTCVYLNDAINLH